MIRRRAPLKRSPLKRSTKPIARRRAKPRRGPFRDPGYLAFLREEGKCVACVRLMVQVQRLGLQSVSVIRGACEAAHGPVNGMRSKGPDNEAVPLCRECHREMHGLGWPAFEERHKIDRAKEAANWYALYLIWKEHTSA